MRQSATLLAKLTRPRLYAPVLRERLFRLLDQRAEQPVIWVSGPPGSGKTTLVASYAEHHALNALWYQVDEADKDPATLFYYLGELARQAGAGDTQALPYFTADYLSDLAGFTRRYFRQFFARLNPGSVLVLDNCQDALGVPLQIVLREAITELPAAVSVIAISREGVPPALTRFELEGRLLPVDWNDLRLTVEEGTAIAKSREVAALDRIARLNRQVDGWAAGLVLLLAHLKRGGSADALKKTGSNEFVFDYFAGEIFDRASAQDQAVLTRTALLPQFTARMAERISGDAGAPKLLDSLYRRQYFIDRRVDREPTYQYHDLFRQFLLARLEDLLQPSELLELRRDAAGILEEQGHLDEAIDLALDSNDYAAAARMLSASAGRYMDGGRWQQLLGWLQQLPSSVMAGDVWLGYWLGVAQLSLNPAVAMRALEIAYAGFEARGDRRGQLLCASSIIDSIQYQALEFHHHEPWIRALEALVPEMESYADADLQLSAWSRFVLATLMREPRHPLIRPGVDWLLDRLCRGRLSAARMLDAASTLMWYAFLSADAAMLRELVRHVHPLSQREDMPPTARVWWWWAYGVAFLLANRWDDAISALNAAKQIAHQFALAPLEWYATVFRAYCYIAIDEVPKARADLDSLRSVADAKLFRATFWEDKGRALLTGHLGRYDEALEIAKRAVAEVDRLGHVPLATTIRCDVVPIAIAAGALDLARQWHRDSVEITRATYIHANDAALAAGQAYLAYATGDLVLARERMHEALTLARNPGMRGQLRWVGPELGRLLCLALADNIEVELVKELIREWRLNAPDPQMQIWPWPIKLRALGGFEIELDGAPLRSDGKAQHRVLELLKAIVAFGERGVSSESMAQHLWPDAEGDAAQASLKTALHRLRKLLRNDEAVRVHDGKISLNRKVCWVDAWAFGESASRALGGNCAEIATGQLEAAEQAVSLYHGQLIVHESHPWLLAPRERLHSKYLRLITALAEILEQRGERERCLSLCSAALEIDPALEPIYRQIMLCLQRDGQLDQAAAAYQRCQRTLLELHGVAPSAQTRRLFESLSRSVPTAKPLASSASN